MIERKQRLYAVQCGRGGAEPSTIFVPASDPEDAVVRAKAVAIECLERGVPNPFDEADAKVRVGTFDPIQEGKINYGDWLSP